GTRGIASFFRSPDERERVFTRSRRYPGLSYRAARPSPDFAGAPTWGVGFVLRTCAPAHPGYGAEHHSTHRRDTRDSAIKPLCFRSLAVPTEGLDCPIPPDIGTDGRAERAAVPGYRRRTRQRKGFHARLQQTKGRSRPSSTNERAFTPVFSNKPRAPVWSRI